MSDEVQALLDEILSEIRALRADLQRVQGLAKVGAAFIKTATAPENPQDEREQWLASMKRDLGWEAAISKSEGDEL